jgi:hypothetical protein
MQRDPKTLSWLLLLAATLAAAPVLAQGDLTLKDDQEKLSYALGLDLGGQMRRIAVSVDPAIFARGLGDALNGGEALMTQEEVRAQIMALQAEMMRRQAEAKQLAADAPANPGETGPAQDAQTPTPAETK